jgi:hypothetical protein
MKTKPASKHAAVYLNLNDAPYSELWIRCITQSVTPQTELLEVHFIGGGPLIDPSSLLSLHNTLTQVPESVRVRTIATCSLSPFSCVAWLAGDERWIARNARVWIPDLDENILRAFQKTPDEYPEPPAPPDWVSRKKEDSEPDRHECVRELFHEACSCNRCRLDTELCTVAGIINEWFPCWEFAGRSLSATDLLELGVIRADWIFGGPRHGRKSLPETAKTVASSVFEEPPTNPIHTHE